MIQRFTGQSLQQSYEDLAAQDADLKNIITTYGYPPLWLRPNTFATLVLIILEQQVSLASAYAAFKKLEEKLNTITPENIMLQTDEELRACYFSRQKISYVRGLAIAILKRQLDLEHLELQHDDVVRTELKKLKGMGDWTVDIYLIHALQRPDVFPIGDLALVNALKTVKSLPATTTKEELLHLAEKWRPHRTIATLLLWHFYIRKKGIRLLH